MADNDLYLHNGQLLPIKQAVVPLTDIEYAYGFGVYETIKVQKGSIYFLSQHTNRLLGSARIIGLEHDFTSADIETSVAALVKASNSSSTNIKLLLVGGKDAKQANLYGLLLNPFYPDRKLYREGAHLITYYYQRLYPHAKTLNMLPSYLAFREATRHRAYDALFIDDHGAITEGSRTNFFGVKGDTVYSPPDNDILLGVMRSVLIKVARAEGITIQNEPIHLEGLSEFDGALVTSTSSKVMPVQSIDHVTFNAQSPIIQRLIHAVDTFLDTCEGKLE